MSISGLMNATFAQRDTVDNSFSQRRAAMAQLGEDLEGGDLEAAQEDFLQLTSKPQGTQSAALETAVKSSQSDGLVQAMHSLGQALEKGDLDEAKQAYARLRQALIGHRGFGHHRAAAQEQNVSATVDVVKFSMVVQSGDTSTDAATAAPTDSGAASEPVAAAPATSETPAAADESAPTATSTDAQAAAPTEAAQTPAPTSSVPTAVNPFAKAFQDLGEALKAGDMPGALKAFGELAQAMPSTTASGAAVWTMRIDVVSVAYRFGSHSVPDTTAGTNANAVA
jgi:hypothetical protein